MTRTALELIMDWAVNHSIQEQREFAEFYDKNVNMSALMTIVTVKDMEALIRDFEFDRGRNK